MMKSTHGIPWQEDPADPQNLTEVELGRPDASSTDGRSGGGGGVRAWPPPKFAGCPDEQDELSLAPTHPESPTGSFDAEEGTEEGEGFGRGPDRTAFTFTYFPHRRVYCTYRQAAILAVTTFGVAAVLGFVAGTGVFAQTRHANKYSPTDEDSGGGAGVFYGPHLGAAKGAWRCFQTRTLVPDDGVDAGDSYFGNSVGVSGNTAVVGAPRDGGDDRTTGGSGSSAAYAFVEVGTRWEQQTRLVPDELLFDDTFGSSVDIDDDSIIVGSYLDDENGPDSGSAYVFTRRPPGEVRWRQQAKLVPDDGRRQDEFGYSVSISGRTAVVGAPFGGGDGGVRTGAAYVFARRGSGRWEQRAKLVPADGMPGDSFGCSVAVDEDTIVVGASGHDYMGDVAGSAYVFVLTDDGGWAQQAKLRASDGEAGDYFGSSVAIKGRYVIVGAKYANGHGSAYVFVRLGRGRPKFWDEQARLSPDDGEDNGDFGSSVSIDVVTAVVGAKYDGFNGSTSGAAYIFSRDGKTWKLTSKVLPGAEEGRFGYSVALDGSTVVIGSVSDDHEGKSNGSVHSLHVC